MLEIKISADIKLNLEGHWPRARYAALCLEQGRAYDEQDYLRWRAVGERLSGEPCFETQVQRATEAVQRLGVAFATTGSALQRAISGVEWHE